MRSGRPTYSGQLAGSPSRPGPFEFLPFGGGARVCLGRRIALSTLYQAVRAVLLRGAVVVPGDQVIDWRLNVTLRPHPGSAGSTDPPGDGRAALERNLDRACRRAAFRRPGNRINPLLTSPCRCVCLAVFDPARKGGMRIGPRKVKISGVSPGWRSQSKPRSTSTSTTKRSQLSKPAWRRAGSPLRSVMSTSAQSVGRLGGDPYLYD